jgi:hypothetical protein
LNVSVPLAAPAKAQALASGHGKGHVECALPPRRHDLLQISGHKADDTDAPSHHGLVHGPGNGSANQDLDPQIRQFRSTRHGQGMNQMADLVFVLPIGHQDLSAGIKNRGDAAVPEMDCNTRHEGSFCARKSTDHAASQKKISL